MTFIHLQTPNIFFKVSESVKEGMNTDDYKFLLYKNTCSFHTERLQCSLNFILKYKLQQLSMLEIDSCLMPQFKPHVLIPSITLVFHFEGKTLVFFFPSLWKKLILFGCWNGIYLEWCFHFQNLCLQVTNLWVFECGWHTVGLQIILQCPSQLERKRSSDSLHLSFENKNLEVLFKRGHIAC